MRKAAHVRLQLAELYDGGSIETCPPSDHGCTNPEKQRHPNIASFYRVCVFGLHEAVKACCTDSAAQAAKQATGQSARALFVCEVLVVV